MLLALSKIRLDGGTQSRACIDPETVAEYADAIDGGADFPAPVVFFDGAEYWLADGFHRLHAMRKLFRNSVECKVMQGTRRDAVLHSVGANATHGKRRTNADKRIAVETLLSDEEWRSAGDSWIATKCAVSHPFVGKVRLEHATCNGYKLPTERQGLDGKTRDVSNIGKSKPKSTPARAPSPPAAPAPAPVHVDDPEDEQPESAPRPIATAPRSEPAPAPIVHRDVKPDNASLPPAKRDVEGERRHLFTLLPTDRRLADALWTVGQLTASERRDLLSRISE